MRFVLFFIALFVTVGCLLGGLHAKHPLHNFGAIIILWIIYYLITEPNRRRIRYWRHRRYMEDQCMRAFLRQNGYWY